MSTPEYEIIETTASEVRVAVPFQAGVTPLDVWKRITSAPSPSSSTEG